MMALTQVIYDSLRMDCDIWEVKDNYHNKIKFKVIGTIDTQKSLFGGLEAAALVPLDEYEANKQHNIHDYQNIYLVICGADVGIGHDIFRIMNASERFIPVSHTVSKWKATFQDWIWSGLLGMLGFVPLFQYQSLDGFFTDLNGRFNNSHFYVMGHSLGGALAQRLALEHKTIEKCVTFAGLNPWWCLRHQQRKSIRANKFESINIVNYYSHHDVFKIFPFFSKSIAKQNIVKLQPFQSRSNLIATLIERIYWAHGTNYYLFDKYGEIISIDRESKMTKFISSLNEKVVWAWWIDIIVFLTGVIPTLLTWLVVQKFVNYIHPIDTFSSINIMIGILLILLSLLSVIIYMLPTLIVRSRWKFIIWILNLSFSWTGIGWITLCIGAFICNSVSYKTNNNILD